MNLMSSQFNGKYVCILFLLFLKLTMETSSLLISKLVHLKQKIHDLSKDRQQQTVEQISVSALSSEAYIQVPPPPPPAFSPQRKTETKRCYHSSIKWFFKKTQEQKEGKGKRGTPNTHREDQDNSLLFNQKQCDKTCALQGSMSNKKKIWIIKIYVV